MSDSPSGEADASSAAVDSTTEPSTATARPPKRSTARPVSGENANIPRMWMLMTNPMTSSPASPCAMCNGVITMTLTMVTWPSARVSRPSRAAGMPAAHPQPPGHRAVGRAGGVAVGDAAPPGLDEGVRPQPQDDDGGGEHQAEEREEERPGEHRQAERAGQRGAGAGEVGADDAADGRRPDDDAEVTRAVHRQREVGCGDNGSGSLDVVAPPKRRLATRSSGKLRRTPAAMSPTAPTAARA